MAQNDLIFLKLGGSLITDKDTPRTPRLDVLARLAGEIAEACRQRPQLQLVLGHGSGSYGHVPGRRYGTRQGVRSEQEWMGFAEVWKEARALNQLVVEALAAASLPVIAFPPSAAVTARDGHPLRWDLHPMQAALDAGLLPLINGDTIFDEQRGGTILSTEDLFIYLARFLHPAQVLLAGREEGVWADYPACTQLLTEITPASYSAVSAQIQGSTSVDVTGGMIEKVRAMLDLAGDLPGFEARIFSGLKPGLVKQALLGARPGTGIRSLPEL